MMVRNRPIVLHDGTYLLPVYFEDGLDTETGRPEEHVTLPALRSGAKPVWEAPGEVRSPKGNIQPAVVELSPGHLITYCAPRRRLRAGEGGWLVRSESRDGGAPGAAGPNSPFPNPNSAVDFLKLNRARCCSSTTTTCGSERH